MKFVKYLLEYKLLTFAMIILMLMSSFCSYISPYITGDIVDRGIQLRGVEYAVPPAISDNDFQKIMLYVSADQISSVVDSYSFNGSNYYLNDKSTKNLQKLDPILEHPLAYLQNCKDTDNYNQDYDSYVNNTAENTLKRKAITYVIDSNEKNGVDQVAICLPFLLLQGAIMLGVLFVSIVVGFLLSLCSTFMALKIGREKRSKLFSSILKLSTSQLDKIGRESLVVRSTTDITVIQTMCLTVLTSFVNVPISATVGIYFAVKTAPSLTWIIVLGVILVIIAATIIYVWCKPKFRILQGLIDNVARKFRRLLNGAFVYRAFNKQKNEVDQFNNANEALYKRNIFIQRLISVINPLLGLGFSCLTILIIGFGSFQAQAGLMQTGQIMAFSSYASMIVSSFVNLGMLVGSLPSSAVCAERLEEVINLAKSSPKKKATKEFSTIESIAFTDVDYIYPKSLKPALKVPGFSVEKGENLAIVGTTGSGKSTLAKLILGLYNPSKGSIEINNASSNVYTPEQIRNCISYSGQNSFMLSTSIKDNICYSSHSYVPSKKLLQVMSDAQIDDFIMSLPEGINSKLNQGSTNISGGQKQRLSIARALARDASIYIFDDCFSALDCITEQKIVNNINKRLKDKIIIYITPKIHIAKLADKILVLDNGEMVGLGTHDDLLKSCSEYIEICKSQAE